MHKVLIAEDDAATRKILVKCVESLGYFAIQVENGRTALELLKVNKDIKLLITDIMMPLMDGRELITKLREDKKFKDLPIIIMSGITSIKEISELLALGASRFLGKPANLPHLKDYIIKYIGEEAPVESQVS